MADGVSGHKLDVDLLTRELGNWRTANGSGPAYLGLADGLRLLVIDGRVPVGAQLPSERALSEALRVSRTTVTAAYTQLREDGYLQARRGARSTTALPAAPIRTDQPAPASLSLAEAAMAAPVAATLEAFTHAVHDATPYLHDIGIELSGVPELRRAIAQRYCDRGLPTEPDQVMVTSGALHAIGLVLATYTRPGDRVLVEQPTYHGVLSAIAATGARPVPVGMTTNGWELAALQAAMRQLNPSLTYLVLDNHNPTGMSMPAPDRQRLARIIAETRTRTVIDETVSDIWLDEPPPPPLASFFTARSDLVITIGSVSKSYWGGLRIGWIRADRAALASLSAVRPAVDMGTAIVEQLAAARLLDRADQILPHRRELLRDRRELLKSLLQEHLPDWVPSDSRGGMSLWIQLPAPMSSALSAAASRLGLTIPAGPRFGVDGTLERFIRVPYALPEDQLREAIVLLARAWRSVTGVAAPHAPDLVV